MAAFKITTTIQGVLYQVPSTGGELVSLRQGTPTARAAVPTVTLTVGSNSITLPQASVTDLITPLTTFSSSGVVS
jgi:hypothetical protein